MTHSHSFLKVFLFNFWDYKLITVFPLPWPPCKPSYMPMPGVLQIHGLLFQCYCMHDGYTYMFLIRSSWVCAYVFRVDCLALDNHVFCSSVGTATPPALGFTPSLETVSPSTTGFCWSSNVTLLSCGRPYFQLWGQEYRSHRAPYPDHDHTYQVESADCGPHQNSTLLIFLWWMKLL